MRTKNAMQLKAIVRNRAKEEGVPPQLVMQNYLLERLLERISLSTWRDRITPEAIEYSYPLMFDDRVLSLMAYPLPTTLAEKLETVISRGVANTRPRDYYDLHTLWLTMGSELDLDVLGDALAATSEKRGTHAAMGRYREVMAEVASDAGMLDQWVAYARRYPYVGDMTLGEACGTVVAIMETIGWLGVST